MKIFNVKHLINFMKKININIIWIKKVIIIYYKIQLGKFYGKIMNKKNINNFYYYNNIQKMNKKKQNNLKKNHIQN